MLNIAYITDDNYVLPTKTSINSIIKNSSGTSICIHIICVEVSESNRLALNKLESTNVKIEILNFNNIYKDLCPDHPYISKAALLKFKLPWIFRNLNRILYIDGDTLLFSGFEQIFETNIDNYFAAVVMDMYTMKFGEWHKRLGLDRYFNSGMMYLNLEKMRSENCSEKLIEYQKNEKENVFMDQNALNAVFDGKVVFVSPKFNFLEAYKDMFQETDIKSFYNVSTSDVTTPLIRHMAGGVKPWKYANANSANDFIPYVVTDDTLRVAKEYCVSLAKEEAGHISALQEKLAAQESRIAGLEQTVASQSQLISEQGERIADLSQRLSEQDRELGELRGLIMNTRHRTLFGAAEWLAGKIRRRGKND